MFDVNNDLVSIKVGLASPEKIREWSKGEVTKPETINYRSQKPEMDGLFCERIFGPSKDYECHCGRYKKIRFQGVTCEKCGVEVVSKEVRRERMGHIELASSCSHIWYLKGIPSRMGLVLEMSEKQLEEIIYYNAHVCLNAGTCKVVKFKEFLNDRIGKEIFKKEIEAIVADPNLCDVSEDSLDLKIANELIEGLNEVNGSFDFYGCADFISSKTGAEFGQGAEAVKILLKKVNLDEEIENVNKEINSLIQNINTKLSEDSRSVNASLKTNTKLTQLTKRLEVLDAFRQSGNKPEWMILDALPVIPPELRPMLPLDGGRFATTDLNDLYRRIISRNNRLKKLISMNAPEVMVCNERRMLQEAVDALIDNGRRNGKPVVGLTQRPLKCLSAQLKGKQGRFRQNLLGKRVDYSGRSVIAIGPELKMYQCGLPREMAINLLRPFIAAVLLEEGKCTIHRVADKKIDNRDADVHDVLERIISYHPVLLNRAPTLHRLGIQAFQPVLVEGRAIRLHPLVCTGFNADFDGDQMAVHVPISKAAQEEAVDLMLASNNILKPTDGKPVVTPGQDILIGNFYLTTEESAQDFLNKANYFEAAGDLSEAQRYREFAKLEGKVFKDMDEAVKVYEMGLIHLHTRILLRGSSMKKVSFDQDMMDSYLLTTVGKVIFNFAFPETFPYINSSDPRNLKYNLDEYFIKKGSNIKEVIANTPIKDGITKKNINAIIDEVYHRYGTEKTSAILDKIKDQGYKYSTISGLTISIGDLEILPNKQSIIDEGEEQIKKIEKLQARGLRSELEKREQSIEVWNKVTDTVKKAVVKKLENEKNNPLYIMMHSGARGNDSNFQQVLGLRGLMQSTSGEIIEIPVKSCLKEGVSVGEFFISTHGARKGGADTALKTADSGYLTRRLVDVSQDVIVREIDCHADHGTIVSAILNTDSTSGSAKYIVELKDRIIGRFSCHDIISPKTGEVLCEGNTLITEDIAKKITDAGIEEVEIRSLFGCETKNGVCVHCYGLNLATGKEVKVGEAIGIMAAQSIGEPGTQLTMRNFNSGGVASSADITRGLPRVQELFEARTPKSKAVISPISGTVTSIESSKNDKGYVKYVVTVENDLETVTKETTYGVELAVSEGQVIKNGDLITKGAVSPKDLLDVTDVAGVEKYILEEIQIPYKKDNGIAISDKHIEVIVHQMLRKIHIIDGGDTSFILGTRVSALAFTEENKKVLLQGKRPAVGQPIILGITKAALETDSFLSAASFQETTRVLTDAAIKGKVDNLHGLKENVITGKLIPAGRGLLTPEERSSLLDNFTLFNRMKEVKQQYVGIHDREEDDYKEDGNSSLIIRQSLDIAE